MTRLGGLPVTRTMVKAAAVLSNTLFVSSGPTDSTLVSANIITDVDSFEDFDSGLVDVKIVNMGDDEKELPLGVR